MAKRGRGESKNTLKLVSAALAILEEEQPMTVRQLFYRLVSAGEIQNNKGDYQKVSRILTTIRKDGRCSWGWIVDRSRPEYMPDVFDDPDEYAESIKDGYRRNYWVTQPDHVEVWVEKDAIVGAIWPVTRELGVRLRVFRGFNSTTNIHEVADHLADIGNRKLVYVYYLGDHDPSGRCIEEEGCARLREQDAGEFEFKRLAIHPEDIAAFELPPLIVKDSDTRTPKFKEKYGDAAVELDALPPKELRRRVRQAIESHIDQWAWDQASQMEVAEVASIRDFIDRWRGMPTVEVHPQDDAL